MPRVSARFVACMLPLLAACEGAFDTGSEGTDAWRSEVPFDLPMLADAVVIGEEGFGTDAGITADPGSSDSGYPWPDVSRPDLPVTNDVPTPTDGLANTDPASDPGTGSPDVSAPCEADGSSCGPDAVCTYDGEGLGHCVPLAHCSDDGEIDLTEMIVRLLRDGALYVKVSETVWVGSPSCSLIECPKENPCCNSCFAQLFIGDAKLPIVLLGRDTMFGCQGTECNIRTSCEPLEPGGRYRVWGHVQLSGTRAEFRVDGFCPVLDEDAP